MMQTQHTQKPYGRGTAVPAKPVWAAAFLSVLMLMAALISAVPVQARSAPESFADLAEELSPSVVNISTTQLVSRNRDRMDIPRFPPGSPFEDFFREFFENRNGQQDEDEDSDRPRRRPASLGSGFIISDDGYVVTNNHVIDGADEVSVILQDDTVLEATIVGSDPKTDVALLKVETNKKLKPVKWGDSDTARIGDWVVAIGNPFGLGGTVTAGIISARSRNINAGPYDNFIQTDAAINKGNSGGPLFNIDGSVIGINTAIFSQTGGSVGIGFAVPSNLARSVIDDLKEFGRTRRGWLGVKIQTVTDEIAESLGLDKGRGALVAEVEPGSPADKAKILSGDIIIEFDDKDVDAMRSLPRIVADTDIGKDVDIVVWRDGKEIDLSVVVGELEEEAPQVASLSSSNSNNRPEEKTIDDLGITVAEITDAIRERYDLPDDASGLVIVDIDGDSDALEKGLRRGDIIDEINQVQVSTVEEANAAIEKVKKMDRKSVFMRVKSGDTFTFVAVNLLT